MVRSIGVSGEGSVTIICGKKTGQQPSDLYQFEKGLIVWYFINIK